MMHTDIYLRLAKVLDTLPNGFPATESGVELKLLRKIFTPEQAELFCDLRLSYESAAQIAQRTGREPEGLESKLVEMRNAGQLMGIRLGKERFFRMLPWVFGIYEFQLPRMDREFAELNEEYAEVFARSFFGTTPQLMQTIPIEEEIESDQETLPFERLSALIENNQSFLVNECICKKEQSLIDNPCTKSTHVCLAVAPLPGVFDRAPFGQAISKEEALELMKKCEEEALVHMTGNVRDGHYFICNCCGCCCGVLRSINELGVPAAQAVNSHYYAVIDENSCSACGICAEERCQVGAIREAGGTYAVIRERCIGCGLCVSTCPAEAVKLVRKDEIDMPAKNEDEWFERRGQERGVDFSDYK